MPHGANFVHKQLRTELEDYIKSQYFGKSPLLLSALIGRIDEEGVLYQKPFIESSPAYISLADGIQKSALEPWLKDYFRQLASAGLGVYSSPFIHQIAALEAAVRGENLFVATGTGSGKTECFMWPLLARLVTEARLSPQTWERRGVRTIIMYPMNALVSDQISRLRRMIGDPENKFISIFRDHSSAAARRPQFGMYTGRTPYPGAQPDPTQDRRLKKTLAGLFSTAETDPLFFRQLQHDGRLPAKADTAQFLRKLQESRHVPDAEDAELITRFEMQQFCPDILITNYSMLEYMLLRPREQRIWDDTRARLQADQSCRLLFVIDEAHMYRGSAGGEVALLLRRLFHKLGVERERGQFILTTASMPGGSDQEPDPAVLKFARELTACDRDTAFTYLTGRREIIAGRLHCDIPADVILGFDPGAFEDPDAIRQEAALRAFWQQVDGFDGSIKSRSGIYQWMYDHLLEYRPFHALIKQCRGNAVSLGELAASIFPDLEQEQALRAVSVLLSLAPLAKNDKGAVLFPARMHMLFRGITGVYACANPACSHAHTHDGLTLGEICLSDSGMTCRHCGSMVYELYNDRRCGALFFKGYVLEKDEELHGSVYLWRRTGQLIDSSMKELHLFIPSTEFKLPPRQSGYKIQPCWLDVQSGFLHFDDDQYAGRPGFRKLYYCSYKARGRPAVITFPTCPHCRHQLSTRQLTSFSTRGNLSFYNLIKAQFQLQPAVPEKTGRPDRYPNEGRKVLLFSDSRQRAARLARDMSEASDTTAARQLFAVAVSMMEQHPDPDLNMDQLYDFFCLAAAQKQVQLFHGADRDKFAEHCAAAWQSRLRAEKFRRRYTPRFTIHSHAPVKMQEYLLRFFAGGYNTLGDAAAGWIEPTEQALWSAQDMLAAEQIEVSAEDFTALFNAWILSVCDSAAALGHEISDEVRLQVRPCYDGYGLKKDWTFSKVIQEIMGWNGKTEQARQEMRAWQHALQRIFLQPASADNGRLYVDISQLRPRYDPAHAWYRCEQCSELTPFLLRGCCPGCGGKHIHQMQEKEYQALSYWRRPLADAASGGRVQVIDTEEHTAQLSHKDQRDEMWSRTEQYELRFQDLIQENETPVDILSSTTTMEVGIDIGSLVAVGLRNIPPMRENYQQRAGRAGRRGSSLSTIITFCEGGPHDTMYFNNPVPMFRGEPRRPWIDIKSEKLLQRHLAMIILQEFLTGREQSLDALPAAEFLSDSCLQDFLAFLSAWKLPPQPGSGLLPAGVQFNQQGFAAELRQALLLLQEKCAAHPELFCAAEGGREGRDKSLLDALYEEGIIPTYSFPKNVVSTYIPDSTGRIMYSVDRGLDMAIGEYAPGRAIVVDKQTYQIGGFYYPGSERRYGMAKTPAAAYMDDPNYVKKLLSCPQCGWFGPAEDKISRCPFCGALPLQESLDMLRPWGFAPKNAAPMADAQLNEEFSAVQQPLYSTLPEADEMKLVPGYSHLRTASRTSQRIIMLNKGPGNRGFMVCRECGAAMPGFDEGALRNIRRPYKSKFAGRCSHHDLAHVNLGYDFITDMLVLEFSLDGKIINTRRQDNPWLPRAAQSLAEALRLCASKKLDVEFTELVTGYRLRTGPGGDFIDIYLYDSLSSGAGYAVSAAESITQLLTAVEEQLSGCDCPSACTRCLQHYRNQHVHGLLDRFAALQLLHWGRSGLRADPLPLEEQIRLLTPLGSILRQSGCCVSVENELSISGPLGRSRLKIYPAMWVEPQQAGTIFVSDALIKYGKPYAVQKIVNAMQLRQAG